MFDVIKRWFDPPPTELMAKPGLMTVLDLALYRSFEGDLTASVCAVHALLQAWLDLKHQAQIVLKNYDTNQFFARQCLDAAFDAIEKISTDRFATSANLSDAFESSGNFSSAGLSGHIAIDESLADTGRRASKPQRRLDCWETARLICPDHVWADDVFLTSQRLMRHLTKHIPSNMEQLRLSLEAERAVLLLTYLIQIDIPMRLHQFRTATEANSVVLKRLYLVKSEYRAPFRSFLEAHQTVQRAPSLELVNRYLTSPPREISEHSNLTDDSITHSIADESKAQDKSLQQLLETPELVEALQMEKMLEELEQEMANGIFGFTELARIIDYKKAQLTVVPDLVEEKDILPLSDLLRRLRHCLCRKIGPETSTGIRPLLLDLQGVPRDEDRTKDADNLTVEQRVEIFLGQLKRLTIICQTRFVFAVERRGDHFDAPASILKECLKLDAELWQAQCLDWCDLVERQQSLSKEFASLSERIRHTEMEASIRAANPESLELVKARLERLIKDRQLRFEVLKDMVEDVCAREVNWKIDLKQPAKDDILMLQPTSVLGLVGAVLVHAGESIPVG